MLALRDEDIPVRALLTEKVPRDVVVELRGTRPVEVAQDRHGPLVVRGAERGGVALRAEDRVRDRVGRRSGETEVGLEDPALQLLSGVRLGRGDSTGLGRGSGKESDAQATVTEGCGDGGSLLLLVGVPDSRGLLVVRRLLAGSLTELATQLRVSQPMRRDVLLRARVNAVRSDLRGFHDGTS